MHKVLIVEDETPLRDKMLKNIDWGAHNYSVLEASSGEQALEILRQKGIDILITDIKMPGMSGMELAGQAKKLRKSLKVIIISGYAEFAYAQQSIRLGVNDYLLKPFRSERLLEVVNLTRAQLLQEQKEKKELAQLRGEMRDYLQHKPIDNALKWLNDDEFFEKQSLILENNELYRVLKTGSQEEVSAEVERVLQEINSFSFDQQQYFIFLNNVLLFTYKIVKELGYSLEELMELIEENELVELSNIDSCKLKKCLKQFFISVNQLISCRQDKRNAELVLEMKKYIQENYSQGITLTELSRHFSISPGYLSKIFLDYGGENFTDYLNKIRMNKAKELLKTTDKKIYQIAADLGFNDSYYFSSWFKKVVGVTPTTYRDNLELL